MHNTKPLKRSQPQPLTQNRRNLQTKRRQTKPKITKTKNQPNQRRFFSAETPSTNKPTPETPSNSPDTTTKHEPTVVFESPLAFKDRFLTLGLMATGVLSSAQVVSGALYSPDASLLVPTIATIAAVGMSAYVGRAMKHRVTRIVVRGPEDPVSITVPNLFTIDRTVDYARDQFPGLPRSYDSRIFFDSKKKFLLLVKGRGVLMLDRNGLFDSSGVLNSILGYDIITYERCAPSLPYAPKKKIVNKKTDGDAPANRDV
jgi:hypothetical protein